MTRILSGYSISRRRLLSTAATGTAGIAAAALIGCSSTKAPAKPAAPATPASPAASNAPAQPKSGGTLKTILNHEINSLDAYRVGGTNDYLPQNLTASQLIKFDYGYGGARASGKISGDLAKSWEQPDPLTIVFKLDPAAKFDGRAPTNGRVVTAEDIAQSWQRFAKESVYRVELANAANKDAPVASMEAIDASTLRVKLARADSLAFPLLASPGSGFVVQSVEGLAGKFDMAKEIRGQGPWILESYRSGVGMVFKRNPDWHGGGGKKPYADALNVSIIPDIAQQEVQFRSKNVHFGAVSQANIAIFAKDLKDTQVVIGSPASGGPYWGMSWLANQPWMDVRVRRAVSMALDRDKFVDVIQDPKRFEALGVKLTTTWNNPMSAGYGDYYLDPKGKDLGPGAVWLQHNVAEAKKLLDAAGFNAQKPLEFDLVYPGAQYGADYPTRVDTWQAMAADAGIKLNHAVVDYSNEYIPKYFRGGATFEGKKVKTAMQYPPGSGGADPLVFFNRHVSSTGTSSATGKFWPQIDDMLNKARGTLDVGQRKAAIQELQRYLADQMIIIPAGPTTEPVDLVWKGVRGFDVQTWPGGLGGPREELWLDGTL